MATNLPKLTTRQEQLIRWLIVYEEALTDDDGMYYIQVKVLGTWVTERWTPDEVQPLVDEEYLAKWPSRWDPTHSVVFIIRSRLDELKALITSKKRNTNG